MVRRSYWSGPRADCGSRGLDKFTCRSSEMTGLGFVFARGRNYGASGKSWCQIRRLVY